MAIVAANGTITINTTVPSVLAPIGGDEALGIAKFQYADSTLSEEHTFTLRDFGRKVGGDGLVTRKGKATSIMEKVTATGARRVLTQAANLTAHADFSAAEVEAEIENLGQFLLDNKADLAAGLFDV